ncbi:MAG: amidohydrolase family protein [Pseudomonadota bacterium]|nr:amidohydrolase family protein [Pseudomonadota bacterium]
MPNAGAALLETRIPSPKPEWLSQLKEKIIEPELPIIDPHHHLWDMRGNRYLLDELIEDLGSGHNVVATVFLECAAMYRYEGPPQMRPIGETEFVNGIAAMAASGNYGKTKICAGIVGFADLTLGASVIEVLEAQINAGGGKFKGIRYGAGFDKSDVINNSHTNPPPGLYGTHKFREGFAKLADYSLSFEAWLYHTQIDEVSMLADAFPDQNIVLNHFGGPIGIGPYENKRAEVFANWKKSILNLSKRANVYVKLGGLGMVLNGYQFENRQIPPNSNELANEWRPFFETTIEAFGPDRCMFESNFPVDKVTSTYAVYWNTFKRLVSHATKDDKRYLFHDTAKNFYRLDL